MCVLRGYERPIYGEVIWLVLLSWSTWVSLRTSSQLCGGWVLPRFLLKDGSLTWMNMVSLMVLVMPCASLPIMVKFEPLPKSPSWFLNILLTIHLSAFVPVDCPTPLHSGVESTNRLQMVLIPLKWICMSRLLQVLLNLLLRLFEWGTTRNIFLLFVVAILLLCCVLSAICVWSVYSLWWILLCRWLRAHGENCI